MSSFLRTVASCHVFFHSNGFSSSFSHRLFSHSFGRIFRRSMQSACSSLCRIFDWHSIGFDWLVGTFIRTGTVYMRRFYSQNGYFRSYCGQMLLRNLLTRRSTVLLVERLFFISLSATPVVSEATSSLDSRTALL